MQGSVTSNVFTDIKEADLQAIVYRCQHVSTDCDDLNKPHPCASCKASNYGKVSFTSIDAQKTWAWQIEDWLVRQAERILRRLGGQSAVDDFRNQLTLTKQNKEQ